MNRIKFTSQHPLLISSSWTNERNPTGSGVEAEQYSFLPKMVFERHEEFGYLNLVQNIISNGDMNDNNTLLSKFGCQVS